MLPDFLCGSPLGTAPVLKNATDLQGMGPSLCSLLQNPSSLWLIGNTSIEKFQSDGQCSSFRLDPRGDSDIFCPEIFFVFLSFSFCGFRPQCWCSGRDVAFEPRPPAHGAVHPLSLSASLYLFFFHAAGLLWTSQLHSSWTLYFASSFPANAYQSKMNRRGKLNSSICPLEDQVITEALQLFGGFLSSDQVMTFPTLRSLKAS